jgi:anti-sigma factor RsiW
MTEAAPHITCQEVVELITDYIEAALPPDEASLFEQHLNLCEGCVRYVAQVRTTVAAAGRLTPQDVPAETRERLLAAFRDWKQS